MKSNKMKMGKLLQSYEHLRRATPHWFNTTSSGRLPEEARSNFCPMGEVLEGRDKKDKTLQSGYLFELCVIIGISFRANWTDG